MAQRFLRNTNAIDHRSVIKKRNFLHLRKCAPIKSHSSFWRVGTSVNTQLRQYFRSCHTNNKNEVRSKYQWPNKWTTAKAATSSKLWLFIMALLVTAPLLRNGGNIVDKLFCNNLRCVKIPVMSHDKQKSGMNTRKQREYCVNIINLYWISL